MGKKLFCSRIQYLSVVVEFPVPASIHKLAKRLKGAKRGIKKPTQPTTAHDETHEVGELLLPVELCKSARIPSKTNSWPLLA